MFPAELIDLLQKYQDELWDSTIQEIDSNIKGLLKGLKKLQNHLSNKLYDITTSDILECDIGDVVLADIKELKQQIAYMTEIKQSLHIILSEETSQENIEKEQEFSEKINVSVIDDDLCPKCNVKLETYLLAYQEKLKGKIENKSVKWYRCLNCNKRYALDFDMENFCAENTNIVLEKQNRNRIFFHDAIVIFNINKPELFTAQR